MKFKIAEKTFSFVPEPEWRSVTEELFRDFQVNESTSADFEIHEEVLAAPRRFLEKQGYLSSPEDIEMSALMLVITDLLRPYGNLFLHTAVVVVDGEAYAFTGHSGVGKSTQCNLWLRHFKDRAYILNGDKSFFHCGCGRWEVYGTPWKGKEKQGINGHAPLKAVFYLSQSRKNQIREMRTGEKAEKLFQQTVLPGTKRDMEEQLTLMDLFVREVPGYSLACTVSDEAVSLAYDQLTDTENHSGKID